MNRIANREAVCAKGSYWRYSSIAAVLTALAAVTALAACKFGLNQEEVEKTLAAQLSERAGGPVEVSCPDGKLKGDVICTVTAEGTSIDIKVTADVKGRKWNATLSELAPGKVVADNISASFVENYKLQWQAIKCPLLNKSDVGTTFECLGTMPDGKTTQPIHVTIEGGEKPLHYNIDKGLILGSKAVEHITGLLAAAKLAGPVDCGKPFFWSIPGSSFTCKTPHGDAIVTINDLAGNASVSIGEKKTDFSAPYKVD